MVHPPGLGDPDDQHLVARAVRGDHECFGALVSRYWPTAVALALSRIPNPGQAEDVAQESFIRAYCKLATLREPSRFAGWLSRIVIQQSIDHVRASKRQLPAVTMAVSESELAGSFSQPGNPGLSAEQTRLIRDAVGRLPVKMQTVVVLRFISGLSTEQIAFQLGQRAGTVRVWLHRAYQKLRADLAPLAEEVRCP